MRQSEGTGKTVKRRRTVFEDGTRSDNVVPILANGRNLMSSRIAGSEEAIWPRLACRRGGVSWEPPRVLHRTASGMWIHATRDARFNHKKTMVVVEEMVPGRKCFGEWNRGRE